jgi:hypothetical protein
VSRTIRAGRAPIVAFVAGLVAGVALGGAWRPPGQVPQAAEAQTAAVSGPAGCKGIDAMIVATGDARSRVAAAADGGPKAGHLGELIFLDSPYAGFQPTYTGPVTLFDVRNGQRFDDLSGFVTGYSRTFMAPRKGTSRDGFARAEVYEFDTPASAVASLTQHLRSRCQDTAATFTIPGLPDAVGISVRGSVPLVADEVLFVRGPRRYLVVRGMKAASDEHEDAVALAVEAAKLAQ